MVPTPTTIPICCRTFFVQDELISEAESEHREYKHYTLPFNDIKTTTLCKTITAFLNHQGGIIYLGIKEEVNKLRKAVGLYLN